MMQMRIRQVTAKDLRENVKRGKFRKLPLTLSNTVPSKTLSIGANWSKLNYRRGENLFAAAKIELFTNSNFPVKFEQLIHYFFRAHQCRAKAGTRKKNTSTTRSWMKNSKTSLPNSFSSILKKYVAQEAAVFQSSVVAAR